MCDARQISATFVAQMALFLADGAVFSQKQNSATKVALICATNIALICRLTKNSAKKNNDKSVLLW